MTIDLQCSGCSQTTRLARRYADRALYCPRCGGPLNERASHRRYGNGSVAVHAQAPPTSGARSVRAPAQPMIRFAGFWIRVLADIIDTLVLLIPIGFANAIAPLIGGCIVYVVYKSLCLAHWDGQTVGKKACGIKVIGENLQPLTPGQALGRTCAEFLSSLLLCIGYIMVAFSSRKQGLHDKIASTLHIYAN